MASRPAALQRGGRLDPRLPPAIAAGLLLLLLGLLLPGLMARIHHHRALTHLEAGDFTTAEILLGKVQRRLPAYFFTNDHLRLALAEGELHFRRAELATSLEEFVKHMESAKFAYQRAATLQPRDLRAFTGLARSVEALERVSPVITKKPYPESAQPIFVELLRLMPVNFHAHRLLIDYLVHRQAPQAELHAAIVRAISLYPTLYFELRDRPFFTPELTGAIEAQLQAALDKQITPDQTLRALADLAQRRGDTATAAAWYRQSIPRHTYRDISGAVLHLGGLELHTGEYQAAEAAFLRALHHGDREQKIRRISRSYAAAGAHRQFLAFADQLERHYPTGDYLELLRAETLLALDQPTLATARLQRVTNPDYLAESYALLARIAEQAGDWDEMELKAQRATVLAPNNPAYHLLFAKALRQLKKLPQAEQAAAAARAINEQRQQQRNRQTEN